MKATRTPFLWAALVAAFFLTACTSPDDTVGFDLPQSSDVAAMDITTSPVEGVVQVTERGCFSLDVVTPADRAADGLWIIWPDNATQDDKTVHLPDGVSLTEGSHVRGEGMITTLDELPDGADERTMIGSFGRYCGADVSGVVALQHVTGA